MLLKALFVPIMLFVLKKITLEIYPHKKIKVGIERKQKRKYINLGKKKKKLISPLLSLIVFFILRMKGDDKEKERKINLLVYSKLQINKVIKKMTIL